MSGQHSFVKLLLGLMWWVLTAALPALGQSMVLQGQVVTEADGQIIPYATISLVGTSLGTVADETGHFRLVVPYSAPQGPQVRISSLGFEPKQMPAGILAKEASVVRLTKGSVSLDEITVMPSVERMISAGRSRGRASLTQDMYLKQNLINAADTVRELGVLLRVPQAGILQSANFELAFNTFARLTLEVQVYRWDKGMPGSPLLPASVRVAVAQKRGWVRVDLREAQLAVGANEGLVLALKLRRSDTLNTDLNAFVLAATPRTRQHFLMRPGHNRPWEEVAGAAPHLFATFGVTTPLPVKRRMQPASFRPGKLRQAGELSYRALRTISAADTDFRDLAFLRQELAGKRVVFLGEANHGDGTAFEAKARLVRYLQQELGYTTLAVESGFYAVSQAQYAIAAGRPALSCLQQSIFPVWMKTREFQPVVADVAQGKLKVMGFDPQLSGRYSPSLVDSLAAFLGHRQLGKGIDWGYLDGAVKAMAHTFSFPAAIQHSRYQAVLAEASQALRGVATTDSAQREAVAFWQQCLVSLVGLARNYVRNASTEKTAETFRASDNNARDQLMADNLLWYIRRHPQEKIICWGATPHFANDLTALRHAELAEFRPMGGWVQAALPGQVYALGITAGEGEYGLLGMAPAPVPAHPEGSVEALLAATGTPYAFVATRQLYLRRDAVTSAFEFKQVLGNWSRVLDGLLYLNVVKPPTYEK